MQRLKNRSKKTKILRGWNLAVKEFIDALNGTYEIINETHQNFPK